MYTFIYSYIHSYLHTYIYIYICIHIYIWIYAHSDLTLCTLYIFIYIYMHIYIYIYILIYLYIYTLSAMLRSRVHAHAAIGRSWCGHALIHFALRAVASPSRCIALRRGRCDTQGAVRFALRHSASLSPLRHAHSRSRHHPVEKALSGPHSRD